MRLSGRVLFVGPVCDTSTLLDTPAEPRPAPCRTGSMPMRIQRILEEKMPELHACLCEKLRAHRPVQSNIPRPALCGTHS